MWLPQLLLLLFFNRLVLPHAVGLLNFLFVQPLFCLPSFRMLLL
jgi:hypothetical protein